MNPRLVCSVLFLVLLCDISVLAEEAPVRIATFNTSLYAREAGDLVRRLAADNDEQANTVATIIERIDPDILFLNEFDYDEKQEAIGLFQANYLKPRKRKDQSSLVFPHVYLAESNTGAPTEFDLDNDGSRKNQPGTAEYARDAKGYGVFPGQYGMVVLSRYPIDAENVRTFRNFLWRDMPYARLPDDPSSEEPSDWYEKEELDILPLSSKSHWDVPIQIEGQQIHLLCSHPTPPVFDGPEDRNGRRNSDEIRFWRDYITPGSDGYIYDDDGKKGGLSKESLFVIVGDLNSDPADGDGISGVRQLLEHARVQSDIVPTSKGGVEQAKLQGGKNESQRSDPAADTADLPDKTNPGNLRLDYVLPSRNMKTVGAGVFWPSSDDPDFPLVGVYPFPGSDHRLVWIDILLRHAN